MHLRIELSKSAYESVPSSLVHKLYLLAFKDEHTQSQLDATSSIRGAISVAAAYSNEVNYLTLQNLTEPTIDLNIQATSVYIYFADSAVEQVLIGASLGDGIGITEDDARTFNVGTTFANNTSITSFDEFDKFTNANYNGNFSFYGCTNLRSINLSNLSTLQDRVSVNGQQVGIFQNSGLVLVTNLGTISRITSDAFKNCVNLTKVVLPLTCKRIDARAFHGCVNLSFTQNDMQYIEDWGWTLGERSGGIFGYDSNKALYTDENVNLPNLISLGDAGFYKLNYVKHVNLPNLLNLSGLLTFSECTNLKDASIGIRDNGDNTYTHSVLNLTVGDAYNIGNLFGECSNLKEVHFSNNLSILSLGMFQQCASLDIVDIDFSKILTIYGYAFRGCNSIGSQNGSKVMNFSNATSLGPSSNSRGLFANSSMLHIYLPKLTTIPRAWGLQRLSYLSSQFINVDWNCNTRINTLYLRDITSIGRGSFYMNSSPSYNVIETLIINNTTVPTIVDVTDNQLINVTANSNPVNSSSPFLNCTIGHIYVPDGYEQTYIDSGLFDSTNAAKIQGISQCPRITVAQANAGLTGVIQDYM